MSTRFVFVPLAVCCCLVALTITASPSRGKTVLQTVAKARRDYARIERDAKHFTRIQTDLSGYSTEGGTLVAYFQDGAARKLVAQYYGETGRATEEYYFAGGRLFFVLRTELRYDKPLNVAVEDKSEVGKVVKQTRNRYYFAEGKLVRWVDESGKNRPAGKEFTAQERETLAQARRLLAKADALLD
ncbi:MAG TPA: hypothetical protein VF600_18255 [Abditibacteriaceae bacterium]|jgi:hypothetical protein